MNKFIVPLISFVLIIGGIIGWTYLTKPTSIPLSKIDTSIEKIPSSPTQKLPTVTETIAETSTLTYVNPSVAIDSFETAIPEKKYNDMAAYMTPNVTIIKYATSCCGTLAKANALTELSYLSDAVGPWNFSMTNPIAKQIEAADPETFKDAYIGTASNNYAVGLILNDNYLITKVIITNNYHLITGN